MSKKNKAKKSKAAQTVENLANVTSSAHEAASAIKKGKAKRAAEAPAPEAVLSKDAVEGERPEWSAELDRLQHEEELTGVPKKARLVLRQQRVRKLKKGGTLGLIGGVLSVDDTQLELAARVEVVEPEGKKGKKAKHGDELGAETPVSVPETTPSQAESDESIATRSRAPRTDTLLTLLEQAQESADLDNRPQVVDVPRLFRTKNYGAILVKRYPQFPNMRVLEDTFVREEGKFQLHLEVGPSEASTPTDSPAKPAGATVAKIKVPKAKGKKK